MPYSLLPAKRQAFFLLSYLAITALLSFGCLGCSSKSVQEAKTVPHEELYIDANLGFSVIHPQHWERIKVPVSSPSYRKDSVSWEIPDAHESGSMSIRIHPGLTSATKLPVLAESQLDRKVVSAVMEAESIVHPAGEAIVLTAGYNGITEIIFAIKGKTNAYTISFAVRSETLPELSPIFEKIAESFREF